MVGGEVTFHIWVKVCWGTLAVGEGRQGIHWRQSDWDLNWRTITRRMQGWDTKGWLSALEHQSDLLWESYDSRGAVESNRDLEECVRRLIGSRSV